jgi:hypothetical protein
MPGVPPERRDGRSRRSYPVSELPNGGRVMLRGADPELRTSSSHHFVVPYVTEIVQMERNLPTALQVQTVQTGLTGVAATDLLTKATHGLVAGDAVRFSGLAGGAGLNNGQTYFVIATGLTANDFRVSTTSGGAQVDFTTDVTAGGVQKLQIWANVKTCFTNEQRGFVARYQDGLTPLIADAAYVDNDVLRNFYSAGTLS